ncbi:hypothetical protein D3C75_224260 [compost metagenome]
MERIEIGLAIDKEERQRVFGDKGMEAWKAFRQTMMDGYRIGYLGLDGISFDLISATELAVRIEFSISASGFGYRLATTITNNQELVNAFVQFSKVRGARLLVEKHIEDQMWIEGPF